MSNHIELDCFSQGPTLSDGHNVSLLDREAGAAVRMDVLVAFLETTVLLDVMKVIPPHYDSALHLGGDDDAPIINATDSESMYNY